MRDARGLGALLVASAAACGPLDAGQSRLEDVDRFDENWVAQLAVGTSFEIRLADDLSARSATVGSPIVGVTVRPATYAGVSVVPAGSMVTGTVTSISKDPPRLSASFEEITIGESPHAIHGAVYDAPLALATKAKWAVLPAGSLLTVVLEHPVRVEVSEVPTVVGWLR
jgi:hypothetical protein